MRLSRGDVPPIYAITDSSSGRAHHEIVQDLITAGVKWIQIRAKDVADIVLYESVRWAAASLPAKVRLFVNDRLDIALACTADGVHLGDQDLPADVARRLAGESPLLIGYSTHSFDDAIEASRNPDIDYVALGPIFRSPTKNVRSPLGPEVIARVRSETDKPIVAIGGIGVANIRDVLDAGADTAAIISALYRGGDIAANVRQLEEAAGRSS